MEPTPTNTPSALDLRQPTLTTLVGYTALYYAWADGLRPFRVAGGRVVGEVQFQPGFGWQQLPLTTHSLKLTESPKDSRHGPTYQVKVQGERAQAPAHVLAALGTMERRPVVLLVRQADGQLRLVGSPDEPLQLAVGGTGQHPGTRAGLDVLFTGLTTSLAPFYAPAQLVVGGSVVGPVVVGGSSVRVVDKKGNLMAIVPAGKELVISSGFRVVLSIQ